MHLALLACIACIGHVTAAITDTNPSAQCSPININSKVQSVTCLKYLNIVDCSEAVTEGTIAVMTCSKYHYAGKETSMVAVCSKYGTWKYSAETCKIPDCGRQKTFARQVAGEAVQDAELPWNIVIYKKNFRWTYHCVGTLISPSHVITTAYCVTSESDVVFPTSSFLLAAHKLTYDYDTSDKTVLWRNVASITKHAQYDRRNGARNIAILVASDGFRVSSFVMPACIDWSGQLPQPSASDLLLAAAMKKGMIGTSLELVASQRYRMISDRKSCISSADASQRRYLSDDKNCTESAGDETCDDRSGAGLTQRHATPVGVRHYLWGVGRARLYSKWTFRGCFTNIGSAFTNLTQYLPWIKDNMM